eukprot:TRINITY_DN10688_c0_g1_i1.p2 TRINITY_DN10688_c0_g1~~TRINITY_DN10688_c0_g1_i1.p2  ORF type:complete len:111 (-),score=47.70 TRINITY_DN10688_c0_g1_i1:81-413(-)
MDSLLEHFSSHFCWNLLCEHEDIHVVGSPLPDRQFSDMIQHLLECDAPVAVAVESSPQLGLLWCDDAITIEVHELSACLLYTSDAADDLLCVDLGGRRIIKKKKKKNNTR